MNKVRVADGSKRHTHQKMLLQSKVMCCEWADDGSGDLSNVGYETHLRVIKVLISM